MIEKIEVKSLHKLIAIFITLVMLFAVAQMITPISAGSIKVIDKKSNEVNKFDKESMNWKVYISKDGKKITAYNTYTKLIGGNAKTTIEKVGKNKLKVTKTYLTATPGNKQVKYVKTKLTPKNYFLKVYKPKVIKEFKN